MSARDTYTFGDPEPDDSDDALMSARWLSEALDALRTVADDLDAQLTLWEERS